MKKLPLLLLLIFSISSVMGQNARLVWAENFGGLEGWGGGHAIAIDKDNHIISTGTFSGSFDFDLGKGNNIVKGQSGDVYVRKSDTSGKVIWTKTIGGRNYDYSEAIEADGQGNTYTVGWFESRMDFDPGTDTFYLEGDKNQRNGFILKLDKNGMFKWAKSLGANGKGEIKDVAVSRSGMIAICGRFHDDFDLKFSKDSVVKMDAFRSNFPTAFVALLDTAGNFKWIKQFECTSSLYGLAFQNEKLHVTGFAYDKLKVKHSSLAEKQLDENGILMEFDMQGVIQQYTTYNSQQLTAGNKIKCDSKGGIYVSGIFQDTLWHNGNAYTASEHGYDVFAMKLDSSYDIQWINVFGSTGTDFCFTMDIDPKNNIYLTGRKHGDLTVTTLTGKQTIHDHGGNDIFLTRLNTEGDFSHFIALGSAKSDEGRGVACLGKSVFINGYVIDTINMALSGKERKLVAPTNFDAFMAKYEFDDVVTSHTELENHAIKLFPNPVVGHSMNVLLPSTQKAEIKIYSASGQLQSVTNSNHKNLVHIEGLTNGLNIIQVSQGAQVWFDKVLAY